MRDCKLNISSSVTLLFQARFEMPSKMAFKWLSWNNLLHLEERLQNKVLNNSTLKVIGIHINSY